MKPITPQDFVNCYGTFVADVVKIASVYPRVWNWFKVTFPELLLIYQTNKALFDAIPTSIRVPAMPTFKPGYGGLAEISYGKSIGIMTTALSIDLKGALTCAEVDPSLIAKIIAGLNTFIITGLKVGTK